MKEIHRERSAVKSLTMKKTKRKRSGLHTTTLNPCSSFKFGSLIFLATADGYSSKKERSLIMLSTVSGSVSESESESNDDWPWTKKEDGQVDYFGGEPKDKVFKVELDNNSNNLLGGGGGGGEGSSSNEEDKQQQQQLVLKMKSLGIQSEDDYCEIVGSCNGLVCLYAHKEVSLWNPNTKEYRVLPQPKDFGEDWNEHLVAFGFDVETKDYKVVFLTGFSPMYYRPRAPIECLCRVQVYSLSTDSWRLLKGITWLPGYPFLYSSEVLYLNGSCFFMAHFLHTKQQPCSFESDRFIISFDFTTEIFTPIQLPDHHQNQKLYLRSLGDKIAIFIKSYHNAGTCEDYNLWVLKEHSSSSSSSSSIVNKESWTKLHFFQLKLETPGQSYSPIGLSDDGEFALLQPLGSTRICRKVMLYHLLSKEVKRNFLSYSLVMSQAIAFKPSLVSIIGGNGASAADQPIG